MPSREPYVKPIVMQLHFSTEPEVAIAQVCKTSGGSKGPIVGPCKTSNPFVPCAGLGS